MRNLGYLLAEGAGVSTVIPEELKTAISTGLTAAKDNFVSIVVVVVPVALVVFGISYGIKNGFKFFKTIGKA